VLYIATVHYGSPRWIEIQARHLRQHISVPYQAWSSLQAIDPSYAVHFDRVINQAGVHAGKLNHLAMEISHEAQDSDLLMFLDGDAFPIADPMPLILDSLEKAPLVAVRRAENLDDRQPHPCFCVTTVGTWRDLHGDWSEGHRWADRNGRAVTDVGGNLLRSLELTGTPWVEVLRSNRKNLDPLFFAIYGDVIYHHGAGFRRGAFRAHGQSRPKLLRAPEIPVVGGLVRRINRSRIFFWKLKTRGPQILQSRRLFDQIQRGDPEWLTDFL
jgi:hypothetical protein